MRIITIITIGLTLFSSGSLPTLDLTPNPATIGDDLMDFTPINLGNGSINGVVFEMGDSGECEYLSLGDAQNAWVTVGDSDGLPSSFGACAWYDGDEENKSCITVNYDPDYVYDGDEVEFHENDFILGVFANCFATIPPGNTSLYLPAIIK